MTPGQVLLCFCATRGCPSLRSRFDQAESLVLLCHDGPYTSTAAVSVGAAQRDLAGAADELSGREAESSGRSFGASRSERQRRRTKRGLLEDCFLIPANTRWKLTIHDLLFRDTHLIVDKAVLLDFVA